MKISKGYNILLSLFIGIMTLFPVSSFAGCDSNKVMEQVKKDAKDKVNTAINRLNTYNGLAQQYESSCNNRINKRSPVYWESNANEASKKIDDALFNKINSASYEYTGIDWNAERPRDNRCRALKDRAKIAMQNYTNASQQAQNDLGTVNNDSAALDCECPENSEKEECSSANKKTPERTAKSSDGCRSFGSYLADLSVCPLCPIFIVILNTDNRIADVAWDSLTSPLKAVVIAIFLALLALETLKVIGNVAGSSTSSYLKAIMIQGLKVLITLQLLSSSEYIYGHFISPTIKGGMDMGVALMTSASAGSGACLSQSGTNKIIGGVLEPSLLNGVYKTVQCFGNSAAILPAVGRGLICHGWTFDPLPKLGMWFSGLVMYGFGLMIWLGVSFYLIDCTVQLGMLTALVPLLVACWPFKITTKYAGIGIQLVMNTFFNFVMMGVVMLLGTTIVGFAAGGKNGGIQDLINAMNRDDLKTLKKIANLDGLSLLILIACCIIALKLISSGGNLAQKFAGGSGSGIGAKMGGTAASAATSIGKGAAKMGGKVVGAAGSAAGHAIGEAATSLYNKADKASGGKISSTVNSTKNSVKSFNRSVKRGAGNALAAAGRKVGLGKYQNQQRQGMPTETGDNSGNSGGNNNGGNSGGNNNNGGSNGGNSGSNS